MKKIDSILKEIFPSEEMSSYLSRCPFDDELPFSRAYASDDLPPEKRPLRRRDIAKAIAGAPISLERKRELYLTLAQDEEDGYFANLAAQVLEVINNMPLKPGEFFYLLKYFVDEYNHPGEIALGAFLTWEQIFDYIQGEYREDDDLIWFEVEKWVPDGNGKLITECDYQILNGAVCYAKLHDFSVDRIGLNYYDANIAYLPVPFHAGDIVTVDCRPFCPLVHVVILENNGNFGCCCLQALHYEGNGMWDIGAVKHNHVFPLDFMSCCVSSLYRLSSFYGQLPEKERLLEQVSRYISGDEKRGRALWNEIFSLDNGSDDGTDRGVSEEQILNLIKADRTIQDADAEDCVGHADTV